MISLLCNNKHHSVILGSNKFHLLSPLNCNVCLLFRTIPIVTMTIIKVMHAILGMIESGEKDHSSLVVKALFISFQHQGQSGDHSYLYII